MIGRNDLAGADTDVGATRTVLSAKLVGLDDHDVAPAPLLTATRPPRHAESEHLTNQRSVLRPRSRERIHNDSDAIRLALREAADRRRRRSALRAEAQLAAGDPADVAEARRIRADMAFVRFSRTMLYGEPVQLSRPCRPRTIDRPSGRVGCSPGRGSRSRSDTAGGTAPVRKDQPSRRARGFNEICRPPCGADRSF
jgi:hypothetical protein